MNKINKKLFLILAVAALVLFSSCVRDRNDNKTAVELRFGYSTEPSTFDPLSTANTADGRSILFNVFEGLVKPHTDGTMLPCIAESWTIEQDAITYNFVIRDNVYFHDGSLLTSADVKFSLDTAIAMGVTDLSSIEEVRTPDDKHVTVILKSPNTEFLPYMTIGIVKAGNIDREQNIIGTGPFFIESYSIQQNLVLRRFDNYWQRLLPQPRMVPYLEKVTIVFMANTDALLLALRGGSIDGARLTGSMAAQLDNRHFDLINSYSAAVQMLALNNAAAPLNDSRVRRAISYGTDVQNIIDAAFFGMGAPSGSPVIPGLSAYYEADLSYTYSPDTARALLAEAGFGSEGRNLTLEITVPSNFTMHVDTAQVVVNQLRIIGIDATIRLVDWATWLSDVYRERNYQATIISVDSPIVSARSFLARYYSDNGGNFINFNNADFDRVFDTALAETDDAQRNQFYREAQRIITSNAASVFIQDIYYFKIFRGGTFGGVLNYPLYVIDFASIYGLEKN